jgi:hypothetical protein
MTKEQTLKDFIESNDLDPETGGETLEFFHPNTSYLKKQYEGDGCTLSIFECKETGVKCAIRDEDPYPTLIREDEIENFKNQL